MKLLIFTLLTLPWALYAQIEAYPGTIPKISRMNTSFLIGTPYQFHHYRPTHSCKIVYSANSESLKAALRITDAASEQFRRRHWPDDFLTNRAHIVQKYLNRTEYVEVYKRGVSLPQGIVGTLAVTWAEYEGKNPSAQTLPEEETLGILLPRPVDSKDQGIIFEFRTFSLDKEANIYTFPFILERASQIIFEKLKDHPELYDQPIIHTYGDRPGILLYKPMGFDLTAVTPKDRPISKYGVNWWSMAMTPRQLEQLLLKLRIPDEETQRSQNGRYSWIPNHPTYSGFNQALSAPLPGAPHAMAAPGTHIALDEQGRVASTILAEDTKFENGIVAAKGAHVVQFGGLLALISKTAKDFVDPETGLQVPKGSKVSFSNNKIIGIDDRPLPKL
jgi:hypothetical protein